MHISSIDSVHHLTQNFLLLLTILAIIQSILSREVLGVGCYVCVSINGSDQLCEDPFGTAAQRAAEFYNPKCMGYRKEREGYFPADHCIKIDGISTTDSNHTIMIRTCSLDSGTLTADTEIVRMSHCGHFTYNDQYFSGCVQSCDSHGCNGASDIYSRRSSLLVHSLFGAFFSYLFSYLRVVSN